MNQHDADALTECRCGGTGSISWREPASAPQPIGDVVVQSMGALGSSLCPCRKALPPRGGVARWWSLERVYQVEVAIPVGNESVSISVDGEVPISEDNYRVVSRGNRYYPTLIDIEVGRESLTLHSDTARELAQRLIAAADAADGRDIPDTDPCGHWAPCDCGQQQSQ